MYIDQLVLLVKQRRTGRFEGHMLATAGVLCDNFRRASGSRVRLPILPRRRKRRAIVKRPSGAKAPLLLPDVSGKSILALTRSSSFDYLFSFTVQNGCFAATNSTGTSFTNPFNQRAHSSIPGCSLGT